MIQVTIASTLFGAMSVAAAIRQGLLDEPSERVLVVANNAPMPEVVDSIPEILGSEVVLSHFDRVLSLNELLYPQPPAKWEVTTSTALQAEKMLRSAWGLGDEPVEIVLESIHIPPSESILRAFGDSPFVLLSEGLMSYGPTRFKQPTEVGHKLKSLIYLDLLPGVTPLLMSEHGAHTQSIEMEGFRDLVYEMAELTVPQRAAIAPYVPGPVALVVGQYMSAINLLSQDEEQELHLEMIHAAVANGARAVYFKPHPAAPPSDLRQLQNRAAEAGVEVTMVETTMSAEVLLTGLDRPIVVACFSTTLMTARAAFGAKAVSVGSEMMLARLKPIENSNRIPLTLVDLSVRAGENDVKRISEMAAAVAFTMQPDTYPHLRKDAESTLHSMVEEDVKRYFSRRRLDHLEITPSIGSSRRCRRVSARSRVRKLVRRLPRPIRKKLRALVIRVRG